MFTYTVFSPRYGCNIAKDGVKNLTINLTINHDWLIDWLMVFYAQAAIFQLFSGDEREMDDKMNMKWKWGGIQGQ